MNTTQTKYVSEVRSKRFIIGYGDGIYVKKINGENAWIRCDCMTDAYIFHTREDAEEGAKKISAYERKCKILPVTITVNVWHEEEDLDDFIKKQSEYNNTTITNTGTSTEKIKQIISLLEEMRDLLKKRV